VSDEFVVAFNCHCSNCRATTGSAFLPWGEIERDKLRVTQGDGSLLVVGDADGPHEVRCGACFSLLYWTPRGGRAGARAAGAHVRRLEGRLVRDPRRPAAARRVPVVVTDPRA
jgi:hypothetical protein